MHALVIHPELSGRTRFRQAAHSAEIFRSVQMSATLTDGIERIRQGFYPITSIFISRSFDRETTTSFMHTVRNERTNNPAAFLSIIPQVRVSSAEVAALAMDGADSILLEPYSATSLQQTTELAHRIVRERSMAYQKAAIELLIPRLAAGIDAAAASLRAGRRSIRITKELSTLKTAIQRIPQELETFYFRRLGETFDAGRIPEPQRQNPTGSRTSARNEPTRIVIRR